MHNHDEKAKDMAESVLPSTGRKRARAERQRIHRGQRARQRIVLAKLDHGGVEDFAPDFREGRRLSATEWMVWDRRSRDKIGSLTRWVLATVAADPDLEDAPLGVQVAHFARMFPDNLIGRHAVQHIEWALRYGSTGQEWQDRHSLRATQRLERRFRLARLVRRMIDSGGHGALNAVLRRHYQCAVEDGRTAPPPPARYLLGAHDVESFITDVSADDRVCGLIADLAAKIG